MEYISISACANGWYVRNDIGQDTFTVSADHIHVFQNFESLQDWLSKNLKGAPLWKKKLESSLQEVPG